MFAGRNEDRKKTAGMTVLGVLEEEADNQLLRFFFMSIIPEMMSTAARTAPNATAIIVTGFAEKLFLAGSVGDCSSEGDSVADISAGRTTASSVGTDVGTGGSDDGYYEILGLIMNGHEPYELIKALHLMPSIVTDRINEAFFDRVGDNILECDGDRITLVEDYREDVEEMLID